jgi:hypothetical protein
MNCTWICTLLRKTCSALHMHGLNKDNPSLEKEATLRHLGIMSREKYFFKGPLILNRHFLYMFFTFFCLRLDEKIYSKLFRGSI